MKVRTHFHLAKLSLKHISSNIPKGFNKNLFYFGTILADCCHLPFTNPHYIDSSYSFIKDKIKKISKKKSFTYYDSLELGIIIHYICDFCCYSHITGGIGNPNKHMLYERQIQRYLLKNINSFNKNFNISSLYKDENSNTTSKVRQLIKFVCYQLNIYRKGNHSFQWDIVNSIIISSKVLETLFYLSSDETETLNEKTPDCLNKESEYIINNNENFRIS